MKYSIVIPTYNHCEDLLKPCIESIFRYSNIADIELIISANGCTDGTSLYLDQLRYQFNTLNLANNFKVAWSDSPSGYPKATNDGIKLATTDKIILLNNDCVLLEQKKNDWLNFLNEPFESSANCGITCVVKSYSEIINMDFAIFFCVMIDKKVFDDIGLLNEEYGMGSSEDIEFCLLAQQKGYEIHQVFEKQKTDKFFTGKFPIYHLGEGTVHDKELVQGWENHFESNKIMLSRKLSMNTKKIGVITTVYNDKEHLFEAIQSVKRQSIDNVIHYIFDDGSTDGLEELMDDNKDPQIRFVTSSENCGQSTGRNVLISLAIQEGCEYVAFLDSDDIWVNPNHLLRSLEILKENDIVYSKPNFYFENGQEAKPQNIPVPGMFIGKQLYHNNFIWISSVVAKIKCFEFNKFDDELNSVEDWDMWIRLYEQGYKFESIPYTNVSYLVRNDSQASLGGNKIEKFKKKHKLTPKLKLHLACGHDYDNDYINVDLYAPEDAKCDVRFDVMKLPYEDNTVDEIKAFHIIEHFHFFEVKEVLSEWYRVLKPGGRLYIETPDFLETCRSFVEGSPVMPIEDWRVLLYGHFFAHPWVPGQTHKFLFTENQMRTNLEWAGFKKMNRLPPASKYVMPETYHLFLTMEAFK